MLYKKMCSERQRLEQEITSLQDQICKLPEGKLICTRHGNYTKWYQSDGHHSTYIPKKDKALAAQLAEKKYLSRQLEAFLHEQKAIDFYLRHHASDINCADELLSDDSPYSELLAHRFIPKSKELYDWMAQSYEHNTSYPEQCIHKTSAGIFVRSKSESLITMLLHINKIPFRYECALHLGDVTIFPDFTIRHPETGRLYYWEHFGMMDNPNYCKNALSKLQLYTSNDIIPSIQLITTYETSNHPFDLAIAEDLVKFYFL